MAGSFDIDTFLDQWEQQRQQDASLSPEDFVQQVGSSLSPEQIAELR